MTASSTTDWSPVPPELAASRLARLRAALETLAPERIELEDEDHQHIGHVSAGGLGHYRVRIVASVFAGKSQIERHRLVYRTVGSLLRTDIHALAIEALAPGEPGTTAA